MREGEHHCPWREVEWKSSRVAEGLDRYREQVDESTRAIFEAEFEALLAEQAPLWMEEGRAEPPDDRPLVLLDVDGVINDLWSQTGAQMPYPVMQVHAGQFALHIPEYMPGLIQALVAMAEVRWCTTWEHDANLHVAPVLGIDPLEVIELDPLTGRKPGVARPHLWRAHGASRATFWIEDFDRRPRGMPPDTVLIDTTPNGVLRPQDLDGLVG